MTSSTFHNDRKDIKEVKQEHKEPKKQIEDKKLSFTTLSPSLQDIIMAYADFEVDINTPSDEKPHSHKGFKLFNDRDLLPDIVHRHVALGSEPDVVKKLIVNHPYLLESVGEAVDPAGRKRRRTLFQRALAARDFAMAEMLRDLLIKYKGKDEADQQYTAQFPEFPYEEIEFNWEFNAKEKLKKNIYALNEVTIAIQDAKEKDDPDKLKAECKSAIEKFWRHIESENEIKETIGFDFDLRLLVLAGKELKEMGDNVKANLYCQQVYGFIQRQVSACDAHRLICLSRYTLKDIVNVSRSLSLCSSIKGASFFDKSVVGVTHCVSNVYLLWRAHYVASAGGINLGENLDELDQVSNRQFRKTTQMLNGMSAVKNETPTRPSWF